MTHKNVLPKKSLFFNYKNKKAAVGRRFYWYYLPIAGIKYGNDRYGRSPVEKLFQFPHIHFNK